MEVAARTENLSTMAEVEDKPPISELPDEMLVEIFSLLDFNSLQEVAKVQKGWSILIGENNRTMKKLKLNMDISFKQWQEIFKTSKNFSRRYNNVSIENCDEWNKDAMNTMKKFGNDLNQLELRSCEFSIGESKMITKILRSLSKLKVLKMYDVDLDVYEESQLANINPLNLDHLKSVVMHESSWNMLEFIKCSQLTSLKIMGSLSSDMEGYLIDYLGTQTKLEELALCDMDFTYCGSSVKASQIEKLNFPLKRLALNRQITFMAGEENAKTFLMRFANTLEQLELGSKFESSFYALVFEKFQKLQSLDFQACSLPKNEDFFKTLRSLSSVKKLVVRKYKNEHQKSLQGIIGNLQNIETLIIEGEASNQLMVFISNNLLKLTSLKIKNLTGKLFHNVKMPESLKKLSVDRLSSVSGKAWSQIFAAIPKVEEFSINCVNDDLSFNEAKFNALTRSWTQLRVLNVGRGFVPTVRMFNYLLSRCPNIRTVRIAAGCNSNDPAFNGFKKPGLRLIVFNPYMNGSTNFGGETDTSLWSYKEARDYFEDNFSDSVDLDSGDSDEGDSDFFLNAMLGGLMYDSDQLYFDSDDGIPHYDFYFA